jgi:hypothetical protein
MGPPDENLILGSDPAVLSSPFLNRIPQQHLAPRHYTTTRRSNVMVVALIFCVNSI